MMEPHETSENPDNTKKERPRYLVPKKNPDLSKLKSDLDKEPEVKLPEGVEEEEVVSKTVQQLRAKRKRIRQRDPAEPKKEVRLAQNRRPKGYVPKTKMGDGPRSAKRKRLPFRPMEAVDFQKYRKLVYLPPVYFFFDTLWGLMNSAGADGALERYYGTLNLVEGTFSVGWLDRIGYFLMLKSSVPYLSPVNWIMWIMTFMAMYWWLRFLGQGWEMIQNSKPGITPKQAISRLFIPGFNLFWHWVATIGLTKRYNTMVDPDLGSPRMDPTLFYMQLCITFFAVGGLMFAVMMQMQYLGLTANIETDYPFDKYGFRATELGMRTFFLGMFVGGAGIQTVCNAINYAANSPDPRDHEAVAALSGSDASGASDTPATSV